MAVFVSTDYFQGPQTIVYKRLLSRPVAAQSNALQATAGKMFSR